MQSQWKPQLTLQGIRKMGWGFRAVPVWAERAEPSHHCVHLVHELSWQWGTTWARSLPSTGSFPEKDSWGHLVAAHPVVGKISPPFQKESCGISQPLPHHYIRVFSRTLSPKVMAFLSCCCSLSAEDLDQIQHGHAFFTQHSGGWGFNNGSPWKLLACWRSMCFTWRGPWLAALYSPWGCLLLLWGTIFQLDLNILFPRI